MTHLHKLMAKTWNDSDITYAATQRLSNRQFSFSPFPSLTHTFSLPHAYTKCKMYNVYLFSAAGTVVDGAPEVDGDTVVDVVGC